MFNTLTTFLVVILLIVWILDTLGLLDIVSALFELVSAVVAAVLLLAAWTVRKVTASRKAIAPPHRPRQPARPEGISGFRGSRKPRSD
jgi:chromate transport protein ChrA